MSGALAFLNLTGEEQAAEALAALDSIQYELKRLNDNLEAGLLNIRTHHPTCIAPKGGDYTIPQLEAMSQYVERAIDEGRLALPPREGGK